jgi:pyrrolysyl-tRNA synthetase-like protein
MKNDKKNDKKPSVRYYRKRVELFRLLDKVKLWPSRRGNLHGIKSIALSEDQALITTHCNKVFIIRNSRNSRAARWLRNKWYRDICKECRVPQWKIAKYSATKFNRRYGSNLTQSVEDNTIKKVSDD